MTLLKGVNEILSEIFSHSREKILKTRNGKAEDIREAISKGIENPGDIQTSLEEQKGMRTISPETYEELCSKIFGGDSN